jgi:hypothetical protein
VATREAWAAARDLLERCVDGTCRVARGDRATGRDTALGLMSRSKASGANQELEGETEVTAPSDRGRTDGGRVAGTVVYATCGWRRRRQQFEEGT